MSEEIIDRCKCTLRESMLGDGCKVCQPRTYIAHLEDALKSAEGEIAQLEADLAESNKYKKMYKFLRNMAPEDFGNLSTINEDFDSQIDAAIKEQQ